MAAKKTKVKKPRKKPVRTLKQRLWLKAFLNRDNPSTFLNKTESARYAKYNCENEESFASIGNQNFRKLQPSIQTWIDEEGLDDINLKAKLISLIDAKQVLFHKVKGNVDPDCLPPGAFIVTESSILAYRGKGEEKQEIDDGDTIVALPVQALETQRKSLEMAMKIKGMFAPEKHEHKHTVDPWSEIVEAVTKPNSDELPNRGHREVQG